MMKKTVAALLVLAAGLALSAHGGRAEQPHARPVIAYVKAHVVPWINDPVIIAALKSQNALHAGLDEADIQAMDKAWRAGVDGGDRAIIDTVLSNAVSRLLQQKLSGSSGTIAEVFIMDNRGLNVGLSDMTSDYWQGDEPKFQKSFGAGRNAIFVDEIEKDESTQALQSQVSMTIVDETGTPIGAITIGVNLDAL